jgi:alpha-1,2-mannosyltransferase
MTADRRLRPLGRAALPSVALVVFGLTVGATLLVAGDTRGYDFLAYHQAVSRVLDGQPAYDLSFEASGAFGLFYYPPTFIPLVLVFGLLAPATAVWAWAVLLIAAFLIGVAVLPVSATVRWWTILLAGLSWPFVYAVKLGQVGPLLFLAFAIGWRWLDEPVRLGLSSAAGTAIKLQPGLVFVWALLTGRWRAVVVGALGLAVLAVLATLVAGFGSWTDFLTLVRRVSDPITTAHNFTPGAVAYQLGLAPETATLIQWTSTIAAIGAVILAARTATAEASFLVTVIASQLLSPILWDHYALLLLLPVAYLLSAGRWWALAIPLATSIPLVTLTPAIVYPVAFWATLVIVLVVGTRARHREALA